MCGIAGLIRLNGEPVSPIVLNRMTDQIGHRGPDGEGHWIEANAGLGHRRLSIIDISPSGHQPMISADHRWVLSYNGEVYNYKELRIELEAEGVWFRSSSDTEVVLYALARWGTRALLRFNGMYGLALWDRQEKKLLIARDRYGIKPLYYAYNGHTFAFASEQKAIMATPYFKNDIDLSALIEYFTFQNIFTDRTFHQEIKLLPAGHFCVLEPSDAGKIMPVCYWDYCFSEPDHYVNAIEYNEELDRLFEQAVCRQLVSDVELGTYLSGGIDSGSITAIAARQLPYIKSFTCGFDLSSASGIELTFDERVKAEAMSARFKTEHYEMVLKSGDMERCLPRLVRHLEEPRVGQSYPNFYVAQLASRFLKVVLSGCGGDELFGGYPWRYYRAANAQSFESYIDQYYLYWQRLVTNEELKAIFAPSWSEVKNVQTKDIFRDVFSTHSGNLDKPEDCINHSLYFEAKTFLHGLFIVEDKLSMAHGLEVRVPFMDNDLVDFAMKCPIGLKLNNLTNVIRINENDPGPKRNLYYQKSKDGKQILRDVMSKYITNDIAEATKQGFSSPDASWFKGESIDFVKRRLLSKKARIYEILDYYHTVSLVEQHLNGEKNRRLLIWSLLNLEFYLCEYYF